MLRDFLKVEKEDRLVEQQDSCSGKANSTDVTEFDNSGKVVVDRLAESI